MTANKRSKRPKPHTFVQCDPNNYYARLGISPLTPTKDIKTIITRKQNEAKKRRRFQEGQEFSEADFEFVELQEIAEFFASDKKREEYDRLNPQNALLTVQLSDTHDWLDRSSRLNFVSAWLVEELGREEFLPTPESLQLWCPRGLDTELFDFLEQYETQTGIDILSDKYLEDVVSDQKVLMEKALSVDELENIAEKRSKQKEDDEHVVLKEQINKTNKTNKPINGLKQGE
jgi:hypothetical protein